MVKSLLDSNTLTDSQGKLRLEAIIEALAEHDILTADQATLLAQTMAQLSTAEHPLLVISECLNNNHTVAGRGFISPAVLFRWLADVAGQKFVHIEPMELQMGTLAQVMSFNYARRHEIVAIQTNPQQVVVASAQPFMTNWQQRLSQALDKTIETVVADPRQIRHNIDAIYSLAQSLQGAQGSTGQVASTLTDLEQMIAPLAGTGKDLADSHIIKIADWLLQQAFARRASDIHLEPRRTQAQVRLRVDGLLYVLCQLPLEVALAVTSRFKILGRLDLAEKRRPQDGRCKTQWHGRGEVELRLSSMPTTFGEKLVIRIFDPAMIGSDFDAVGLAGNDLQRWQDMITATRGMILVTGPTGSGKTTTLYITLKQLAGSKVNICTVEDPIEIVEAAFNQTQVQHAIGLDFANGVRALLRQDPDIIMVGEIRDAETAEVAVQAALTGHLVFATMHTGDSASAIVRLLELTVPAYLIRATLLGVLAQRLVRRLCTTCYRKVIAEPLHWQAIAPHADADCPQQVFEPSGCSQCRQIGYSGRVGLFELLPIDHRVKDEINEHCDLQRLRDAGLKTGMRSLRQAGCDHVATGATSIDEILRVIPT